MMVGELRCHLNGKVILRGGEGEAVKRGLPRYKVKTRNRDVYINTA